ncbi:hypothetical protein OS190_00380 [Sulfitobacter sp. F26204]|uniref:hypothetical protein n=1 Tax=Sulfitobacter sp. F26204 TaxID=2996014 RepID=UPI00225E5A68|nr:hypothetical protein [Sulfitobacter sp. F26204]MCX7558002.1 hypothetical protein [Sulfitobacter sp. F26204]
MPQENDPTQRYLEATQKYQTKLHYLWKTVFKKVNSILRTLTSFLNKFIAEAAKMIAIVGKAAVNKVIDVGQRIIQLVAQIPNALKQGLRYGRKIISLITKAKDPNKIISTLKKLFARYVRMIQEIHGWINDLASNLDVIGTAFSVVNAFKRLLQAMFSWITEITRANDAALKVKRLLKKVQKEIKKDKKELIKLRKDVMRLKKAA